MKRKQLKPETISKKGAFSLGYKVGDTVYVSAQIPNMDEQEEKPSIRLQTMQVLDKIELILKEADMRLMHVVSVRVNLLNFDDAEAVGKVFSIYFSHPYPARSIVEVRRLEKDAPISIEVVAVAGDSESFEDAYDESGCEGCCCEE